MQYFNTLPKVASIDYSGNQIVLTNLLVRVEVIPSLFNNPLLFYTYDIQDGDTPEIIAQKYYGDPYRYWIILFANNIIDPQAQWPKSTNLFNAYIVDKYINATANSLNISSSSVTPQQVMSYVNSTIQNYVVSITTTENNSSTSNTITYLVDQYAYANTMPSSQTAILPDGSGVSQSTTTYTQSIYNYEVQQNEKLRTINIIDSKYISIFESQFKSLAGA